MPRLLRFAQFSVRDLWGSAGPTLLGIVLLALLAYWLVDPTPPSQVVLSTGQDNSAYADFGQIYAKALAKKRIKLSLLPSQGSQENLQRLKDPASKVDIAFVQSGSTDHENAQRQGLISLGSLFTEPVWIFYRDGKPLTHLAQLAQMKVNAGTEGSGVPRLVRQLLQENGIDAGQATLGQLDNTHATIALLDGRIDALVFSSAPEAPLIQMLLQTPGIKLFDFAQAEAWTRRLPYLTRVVLPRGVVNLGRDIPAQDIHLIAPTATLVARESIHPALIDLFVQQAAKVHGGAGWFRREGDFPTAHYSEIPVAAQAVRFYEHGVPFLQRYLPFALANFLDRMWVVLVAFGALVLPLSKVIQPLYVWRVRSRVYRWYGELRIIEQALEHVAEGGGDKDFAPHLQQLAELEENVNRISVPLSFADSLYDLRAHIHLVRGHVLQLMLPGAAAPLPPGAA